MNPDFDHDFETWLEQEFENNQMAQAFYQDCIEHDLERLHAWG